MFSGSGAELFGEELDEVVVPDTSVLRPELSVRGSEPASR